MRDTELYSRILGIEAPWTVDDVVVDLGAGKVEVHLADLSGPLPCPECGASCPGYDRMVRRWRHLDTCQLQTILVAEVPRVRCEQHGVKQIRVPWGEPGSKFTAMMEALIIDWLLEAPIEAVRRRLGLSWSAVDTIRRRAIARGLERREKTLPTHLAVDETSFQKRHEYVTVVLDSSGKKARVLHVADGRSTEALGDFLAGFCPEQLAALDTVTMDMWAPYAKAVREHVPDADSKIAYDRFHVAQHLGFAVDQVRRQQQRVCAGDASELKGLRWLLLRRAANLFEEQLARVEALKYSAPKIARAWAIKEAFASIWQAQTGEDARRLWRRWHAWAIRSRLEPIKKVARMIQRHLAGILNAVVKRVSNARAESFNSLIQKIKRQACGFRNRERFRLAIYFHLGGLDLYPSGISR